MKKKVGILVIHGIGKQKVNYSLPLQNKIKKTLSSMGKSDENVCFEEVYYSDIFDTHQKLRSSQLIHTSGFFQPFGKAIRWALTYILSDAVSYRGNYKEIHERISESVTQLQSQLEESAPIIIVAHSMGVISISDYIYDLQEKKYPELKLAAIKNLKALITYGCNIPLFEMGFKETTCIKRPLDDIEAKDFYWLNFYSSYDVLGYRMEEYYNKKPDPSFELEDRHVFSGGLFSVWNLVSHIGYWKNKKVNKAIAKEIIKWTDD